MCVNNVMKKFKFIFWCVAGARCTIEVLELYAIRRWLLMFDIFVREVSAGGYKQLSCDRNIRPDCQVSDVMPGVGEKPDYAVLINCTATLNIITATIRSSRRQVAGRASHGASQAAPIARVENHNTEALAAPAT
jgi:hypothetical protein